MPPLLSVSTPSLLATSLTNLSSSRHRPPSLTAQREEGWTEVWGGKDHKNSNNNDDDDDASKTSASVETKSHLPPRYIHVLNDDCDDIGVLLNTKTSSSSSSEAAASLTLTQYRVAWYEQIILRMCHIPHTVENSSYAARECTGALPCLLDLNCGQQQQQQKGVAVTAKSSHDNRDSFLQTPTEEARGNNNTWNNTVLSQLNKPVYIGRNQPGGLGSYFFHQCQTKRMTNNNNGNGDDDATPTMNDLNPSSSSSLWFVSSGSHIIDYLRMKYSNSIGQCVLFPEHLQQQQQRHHHQSNHNSNSDAMAYESFIQDKLNYILLALRYGNDPAWEGIYKQQCIQATLDPNFVSSFTNQTKKKKKTRWGFFSVFAWYQTYSERALALCHLIPSRYGGTTTTAISGGLLALDLFRNNDYRKGDTAGGAETAAAEAEAVHHQHHPFSGMVSSYGGVGGGDSGSVNVYRAMEYADMYYTALEQKMVGEEEEEEEEESPTYFLGTSVPSYIDALLFSHLAEALCDVYLVLVLAKHSRLMKYFQWMYDQYFGEKYVCGGGGDDDALEWVKWNNVSTSLNAFNQIPEAAALKKKGLSGDEASIGGGMTHAISLMQQLAIHCHELDEAMRDAAALRLKGGGERIVLEKQHRPIGSTLYRWLMGVDVKFWGSKTSSQKSLGSDDGKSNTNNAGSGEEDEQGDSEDAKKAMWEKHMEQVKRDRRYSDEVWISGVVVTFVGALLLSYTKSKK